MIHENEIASGSMAIAIILPEADIYIGG